MKESDLAVFHFFLGWSNCHQNSSTNEYRTFERWGDKD